MRTAIIIAIFAIITVIVGLLPVNAGNPFGRSQNAPALTATAR